MLEARIGDIDECGVGFDSAEGPVFDGHVEVGEQVKGAALADVGHAQQPHF